MSEVDEGGEKSHAATEHKLDEARKRGDRPLSTDATTAAVYLGFGLTAMTLSGGALVSVGAVLTGMLSRADRLSETALSGSPAPVLGPWLMQVASAVAPWFGIPAGLALLALLAQGAPAFTPSRLAPKLSRISPLSTAKQKFGTQGIVEFLKSLAKLTVLGTVLGQYTLARLDEIIASAALEPGPGAAVLGGLVLGLVTRVIIVACIFAVADVLWQQASFRRRNRMTRQEVIEEMKESEGDPALKQQRRARAVAIATAPLRKAVAGAEVVIVNPTHYAVALAWDRTGGRAPVCVAKGMDEIAARIREIAAENGVPIQSDPPTARAIHAEVPVGQEIDRRHYRAVAAAIRFAERIRDGARA